MFPAILLSVWQARQAGAGSLVVRYVFCCPSSAQAVGVWGSLSCPVSGRASTARACLHTYCNIVSVLSAMPRSQRHAYISTRRPDLFLFFFFFGGSRLPPLGSPPLGPGGPGGPCGLGGLGLRSGGAGKMPYAPPRLRLRSMLSASLEPDSTLWLMLPARRSWAVSTQRHSTAC